MPPQRQQTHPLGEIYRLLVSRGTHLTVGVLTVLAVLFSGWDATRTRPSDGTVWSLGKPVVEVIDILSEGTPLQRGDIIEGINANFFTSPEAASAELRRHRPGDRVEYFVRRGSQTAIEIVSLESTRVDLNDYSVNVMLAMVYLVIGFAVYLRSANERAPGLFFLLCLLFALYFMTNLQQASYFLGAIITQNIGALARFMLPAVFLHFFLVFPRKKFTLTQHPFLAPLLYIMPLMFYVRFSLDQFIGAEGAKIHAASWIVLGIYYVLGLSALLHGYFSYRDPLMRQRVRILTFGTLAAVVPFLVFKIGMEELNFQTGLTRLGAVPLAAIPISFGYCVARYQVLQIDLLLKRNLAYGLLTGTIWAIYLGGTWWLGGKVLGLVEATSGLFAAGATLGVAALLWPVRVRLQRGLDFRFYHSRDNMAALIEEFSKEIPRLIQRETLLTRVGQRLVTVLDLPGMAVYAADGDAQFPSFDLSGCISGRLPQPSLDEGREESRRRRRPDYPERLVLQAVAQVLERQGEPLWADAGEFESLDDRLAITREQAELKARVKEQHFLVEHGIQLLVPMVAQGRLVGIMALPHRGGDGEYQVHELQLLSIVAGQVALQVENSRLYEEEVAKQKLEEEMAMARRIQSRLLPSRLPSYAGVEIEAVNISSKQVSGDYYDMFERTDGKLALVIADVSGKGMPASLLASNIQAALRGQCYNCDSPGVVLERINQQIHASTDPEHFATLFLAVFDPVTRHLEYSSGGHNAPVLLRADGTVELLDKGGLPLGAFDFGTYEEGHVDLAPGDLLFLYTDGLTETKDPDGDDEFGEDRLSEVLRENRDDVVQDIFARIDTELRAYSGRSAGQVADDDITMIGLKIVAAAAVDEVAVAEGARP
ncbi:SpoIIE family protein phosphatase [bacterium]|nr:SpoIIE family protein phosphatase [bacterium]